MKPFYLLDTNIVSEPTQKKKNQNVMKHLKKEGAFCAVSSITIAEIWKGVEHAKGEKQKILEKFFYNEVCVLYKEIPFDHDSAIIYGSLFEQMESIGKPKPTLDLLIAAIAIANNMVLVTRNTKDFADIPNLKLENWFEK